MRLFIPLILLAQSCFSQPQVIIQDWLKAASAVTTTPGCSKTSLIAWYDFTDRTDAHSTNELEEVGTPSYTAGPPSYGSAVASNVGWTNNTIPAAWIPTEMDATMVIRFRPMSDDAGINYIFVSHNSLVYLRWATTFRYVVGGTTFGTATAPTSNVWHLTIVEREASSDIVQCWVNDGSPSSVTNAYSDGTGFMFVGGSTLTSMHDIDFDFIGLWNRKLTTAERTWLYNSGGTRTYSELSE